MALSDLDKNLGYVALHQRVVTREALGQCVEMLERDPQQGLGSLLVRCGYVSPDRLGDLMRLAQRRLGGGAPQPSTSAGFAPLGAQSAPIPGHGISSMQSGRFNLDSAGPSPARQLPQFGSDEHRRLREQYEEYVFGQLLIKRGILDAERLRGVMQRKGAAAGAIGLGRQLINEGVLNADQVKNVAADLQRKIVACQSCGNCYYVEPSSTPQRFSCRRCNATVEVGAPRPASGPQPSPYASANGMPSSPGYGAPRPPSGPQPQPGYGGGLAPGMPSPMGSGMGGMGVPANGMAGMNGMGSVSSSYGAGAGFPSYGGAASSSSFAGNPYGAMPNSSGFGAGPQAGPYNSGFQAGPQGGPFASGFTPSPSGFGNGAGYVPSVSTSTAGFAVNPNGMGVNASGFTAAPNPADFDPNVPMAEARPGGETCPETFGDYHIDREIARGGMGVVYLANKPDGPKCALKVMLESVSQNPKRLKRFQREIDAHRKLIHENIVRILDAGKVDDFYFFTMEYVDGKPLDERLKEELDIEIVMEILEKICRATDYAHSMGVVHRDLKPANVLVTSKMIPKLTDFGLAKSADHVSVLTKTGAVVGTPYYLSPEQASGQSKDVDHRADVYALGVMMYEMITGRLPFTGKTSVELFRKIIHEDPIPPTKIKPQLTEEIERVCLKALEKNPADRYQSAGALADDIRCLVEGNPISARKPSFIRQWFRQMKKKGLASIIFGAGIGIAVLGGLGAAYYIYATRQAAYVKAVGDEWQAYSDACGADKEAAAQAVERARRLTRRERGKDALDAVNEAIVRLALLEFRGGFSEDGDKILEEAGAEFTALRRLIKKPEDGELLERLKAFGVELQAWPEPLTHEENIQQATREREEEEEHAARRQLLARAFIARGYGKMVLDEPNALEKAKLDFDRVPKLTDGGMVLAQVARGDLLVAKGKLDEAIKEYETALFNRKETVEAYLGKAEALFLKEQFNEAHETLESALKVELPDEGRARILARRALATVKLEKPDRARESVDEAVQLAPELYETHLAKALVLAAAGDHLGARAPFEKAKELAAAEQSPDVLVALARNYLERRLYEEANEAAAEALRLARQSLEASVVQAQVFECQLNDIEAMNTASRVRDRCLTQPRHWMSKALACQCLARISAAGDKLDDAIRYAKEATAAWPDNSEGQLLTGYLLLRQGQKERAKLTMAEEKANWAMRRGNDSVAGKRLLGLVHAAQHEKRSRATSKLKDVIRLRPHDPWVCTEYAQLHEDTGGDAESVARFRERALAAERDVSNPEGDLYARTLAILQQPIPPDAREDRLALGERVKTARAALEKATFYNPKNVHVLTLLGQLAIDRQTFGDARTHLNLACESNPLFLPAFLVRAQLSSGAAGRAGDGYLSDEDVNAAIAKAKALTGDNPARILSIEIAQRELAYRRAATKKEATDAEIQELIGAYDFALSHDPNNLEYLDRKLKLLKELRALLKTREAAEAVRALESLMAAIPKQRIKINKELEPILEGLRKGQSQRSAGLWKLAQECPRLPAPWEALTRAALSEGDATTAIAALSRLAQLDPAQADLALPVLELAAKGDPKALATQAQNLLRDKGGLNANFTTARLIVALSHAAALKTNRAAAAEAQPATRQLMELRPELAINHILSASLDLAEDKKDDAVAKLELALALTQRGPNTCLALASVHMQLQHYDLSLRLLRLARAQGAQLDAQRLAAFKPLKDAAGDAWSEVEGGAEPQ